MKVVEVQVQKFRNVVDSTTVKIQGDVTCLVGKNESGKTTFLDALYLLKPRLPNAAFDLHKHYPAWLIKRHRQQGDDLEKVTPIRAVFDLEEIDHAAISARFGTGALKSKQVTVAREYSGKRWFTYETDEKKAVAHAIGNVTMPEKTSQHLADCASFEELVERLSGLKSEEAGTEEAAEEAASAVERSVKAMIGDGDFRKAVMNALDERLPTFFKFSDYAILPSEVDIRLLLDAQPEDLTDEHHTALSLLRLGGTDDEYLLNPEYEVRKREIESVANALTEDVLAYWTQNPELRVQPDLTLREERNEQDQPTAVLDQLKIRVWDERHRLSLPFHERSTGFRWFFSFLAAFSEYEYSPDPVVILLDEPALGLHARAQGDFLRFIDERLAPKCQVIYTTHSPFMVQAGKLERVRLVEDTGREHGSQVSDEILGTDPDTLFPLQAALGYDLVQNILVPGPNNLLVEGTSDFTYLTSVSDFLKENERTHLDDRWSVVAVGSADMLPTFVALLGHHLDVSVLVDSRKAGHQKLARLADGGYLEQTRVLTVGRILGRKLADIEDVFTVADYLAIYNGAFGSKLAESKLKGSDPIVNRIARHAKVKRFDHGKPADYLLRNKPDVLGNLSDETLGRFENLFAAINATLPEEED